MFWDGVTVSGRDRQLYPWGYLELSIKIFENQIHGINGFMLKR